MTALEMAGAYATFANRASTPNHMPIPGSSMLTATSCLENVPEFTQVYKPETAFIMTDILKDVLQVGGTASGYGV